MSHHRPRLDDLLLTRRELLRRCGMGFAALGLAPLLAADAAASVSTNPLAPKQPHFPAKAQRVIHPFMNRGPSPLDPFDPKPALLKFAGKPLPTPGANQGKINGRDHNH